jgi:hypothetical protein
MQKQQQGRNTGVLRLRLAQSARQTPLRMTACWGWGWSGGGFEGGDWAGGVREGMQGTGNRDQGSGNREQGRAWREGFASECREQGTGIREQARAGREGFASECREQGTGIRDQARAGGVRERMATPIHAMRPHEWVAKMDFCEWAIRLPKGDSVGWSPAKRLSSMRFVFL